MSESLDGIRFSQSVTILVIPQFVPVLVDALLGHIEQFTSKHLGFVSARVQVCEVHNEVHLLLSWQSKKLGEQALRYPKKGEPDFFQLTDEFQVRSLIFKTFVDYALRIQ